jgi:chromosome segregation ATPase
MPSKRSKQQGIQAYITRANSQPEQLANMSTSAGPATENTQSAITEVSEPATVQQLSVLLENQRASMKEDMAKLIQTTSQSLKASVDALRGDVNSFNKRLTETETRVGENFERITSTEATVKSLESQNKHLLDRVEQPFSKWVPRDCVRGAAKKLRILTFNKKKKKTDISYMTYMNILGPILTV